MPAIDMDKIYVDMSLDEIPWDKKKPPEALVELVKSKKIQPCKTIDLGCGTGNYAVYLTSQGFDVTGVDISPTAINIAKENAEKRGIKCKFQELDLLSDFNKLKGTFDFVYDWLLLHHIFPKDREKYLKGVKKLLNPGGKYLSVCFSEEDPQFGGFGKYIRTQLDTILYLSSEREMRELFKQQFRIKELKTIELPGKSASHFAIYAFMEKGSKEQ